MIDKEMKNIGKKFTFFFLILFMNLNGLFTLNSLFKNLFNLIYRIKNHTFQLKCYFFHICKKFKRITEFF